jgi:small subunit ribosomal protein S9
VASPASKTKFYRGTGRRKTSVARVRLTEGTGKIIINGKDFVAYFNEDKDRYFVEGPLLVTDLRERVDVVADVKGGGATGQAGAVGQGLARAIKIMFGLTTPAAPAQAAEGAEPTVEDPANSMDRGLRDSGFLTRDGRMKERKKYGRKGARKSFQFSKR